MRAWIQLIVLAILLLMAAVPAASKPDLLSQAEQAYGADDYSRALNLYEQIAERYPDSPLACLRKAQCLAGLELWDESKAAFEHLGVIGAMDADARLAYGDMLKDAGQLAQAIEQYNIVLYGENAPQAPPATPLAVSRQDNQSPVVAREVQSAPPAAAITVEYIEPVQPSVPAPAPVSQPAPDPQPQPVAVELASGSLPGASNSLDVLRPQELAGQQAPQPTISRLQANSPGSFYQPGGYLQAGGEDNDNGEDTSRGEDQPDTADDALLQARRYLQLKQYEKAVEQFELYREMTGEELPRDVALDYGDALREAGEADQAEQVFSRLLHKDAADVDAKVGLAKTLAKRGELEDALYLLDQIYQSEEALLKAYVARAYAFLVNGYVADAWSDLGEAMAIDPNHPDVVAMEQELSQYEVEMAQVLPNEPALRADALFNRGDYAKAQSLYEQVVRSDPGNTRAWLRLATMYRWDSLWADSLGAYEEYLSSQPYDYEARLRYAQVLYYERYLSEAENELADMISDPDIPVEIYEEALVVYAAVLNALGRQQEAAEWYREALVFLPHDVSARSQYAGLLAAMGDYDAAVNQYKAALKDDPTSGEATMGLARTYAWQGEQGKAQELYDDIGMTDPYYGASRVGKAYSHYWEGDRAQALAEAAEAARYDPDNSELATLRAALTETRDPALTVDWRQFEDSDDNDKRSLTTRVDVPLTADGARLSIEHEDFKLDSTARNEESTGTYTRGSVTVPLNDDVSTTLRAGYLDIDNGNLDPAVDDYTYGAAVNVQLNDKWDMGAGYSEYTFYDTTQLARNGIEVEEFNVSSNNKVARDTNFIADYGWGDLSDGNDRDRVSLTLQRNYTRPGTGRLFYGLAYRYLDYTQDLNSGYWDPSNYNYAEVYADWYDLSDRKFKFDGGLGWGIDNADGQEASSAFRYHVGMRTYPFGDRFLLRAGYRSSEAQGTAATGPGYESEEWYLTGVVSF